MIPGNPPHHSKADEEPVTIDLEANEAARRAVEHGDRETGATSADEVETPLDAKPEPIRETVAEALPEQPASPAVAAGHGTPALIAAGIVGGLIALVCAGAVQYAGLLPPNSSSKDNSQTVSALSSEIDGLKQTVASLRTAPTAQPDAALEARIAALETTIKNAPLAASANGTATATADPAASQKIADLTAEVDQLKANMTQTTQTQASTGADISKRLDDAEKKLSEPGKDVAVAQAIAAAGLKAAIDRGGPFRAELDTFAGVSPDDPTVATLRSFADIGVPSRAELIRQVPEVATAIIGATQKPDENQGWSDRLMASAKSLVTVRPVGNIEGDSVAAIAARFEDKIRNGDLPGAVTEWNSLPDAGKTASAAFKQSIEARIKVEDLVGETLSKAIAGAGKQS
jgi:hypothetical protein